jgi:hypothetical protein
VSKKTKIILDIDDSEMNLFKKQYINAGEVKDEIEKLEYEEDKLDKRKKEYKLWKDKMNFLIDMYNIKVGWKAYKKLE